MKNSILREILDKPINNLKLGQTVKRTQNRESLRLYRDLLKFSNEFDWKHPNGQDWREIIRRSARKEFELARDEKDSYLVMKMILTSREAITKTREKMNQEFFKLNNTLSEKDESFK